MQKLHGSILVRRAMDWSCKKKYLKDGSLLNMLARYQFRLPTNSIFSSFLFLVVIILWVAVFHHNKSWAQPVYRLSGAPWQTLSSSPATIVALSRAAILLLLDCFTADPLASCQPAESPREDFITKLSTSSKDITPFKSIGLLTQSKKHIACL